MSYTVHIVPASADRFGAVHNRYHNRQPVHKGDSGIDVYIPSDVTIGENSFGTKIRLGIRCQIINNATGKPMAYMLMARSSISRSKMRLSNAVGLIDCGYTGELMAAVDNFGPSLKLMAGDRYFQLVIPAQMESPLDHSIEIKAARVFPSSPGSTRSSLGFGSTGLSEH